MGCCLGKKDKPLKVPDNSLKTINYSSSVRSNRVPAGRLVKQCSVCRTRSISDICPICETPMIDLTKK